MCVKKILLIFGLLTLKNVVCDEMRIPHIAIIGGGIGGASTSHFLTELFNANLKIDLYEAKAIGGRLANLKLHNDEYEAGGSIIHNKNMYMQNFVKLLGLEHSSPNGQKCGIWNGDEFVYIQSNYFLASLVKLLYRYGFQIIKLHRQLNNILDSFENIYHLQDTGKSFANVTSLLGAINKEFPKMLQISMKDYLLNLGFTENLINELIEAIIVVNYGQDVDIQTFVSFVSLAGADSNLWCVKGGNKGVPEHLIYRNKNVNIVLNHVTKISYIMDNNSRQYEVSYANEDNTNSMTADYDIVIIAAPLTHDQKYPIKFIGFPGNLEFPDSYQTTHVTFIKADLNPNYIGVQQGLNCVMSCNPKKTKISSIAEVKPVDALDKKGTPVWKIFSREELDSNFIHEIFSHVVEKKTIAWKAYPRYSHNTHFHNFKLHDALYHVNAIEWIASAMEMSAIGGRNVAILAHDDFLREHNSIPDKETMDNLYEKDEL